MKIDCMIVGAEKAGTTSLLHYLDQHPEAATPTTTRSKGKQVKDAGEFDAFLRDDLPSRELASYVDGAFDLSYEKVNIRLAKCVNMLYSQNAIARFVEHNAKGKAIVSVRSPIARAISSFNYQRFRGEETATSFVEAVTREVEGKVESIHLRYILKGQYYSHIAILDELLGRENVHVLVFEDLLDQPELVYRQVCEFVGLDREYLPDFEHRNKAKAARWQGLAYILNEESVAKKLTRRVFSRNTRRRLFFALRALNSRQVSPSVIPDSVMRDLSGYFAEDVRLLSKRIGVDLQSRWRLQSMSDHTESASP